jgi:adenine-specific DNA-methyltransferase
LPEPLEADKPLDDGTIVRTIADICRERVRRAGKRIAAANGSKHIDIGFRSYRLAPSNFRPWDGRTPEMMTTARQASFMPQTIQQQLELAADHLRPDANNDALLAELLLRLGFELTTPVRVETLAGKTVHNVDDGHVMICLDRHITLDVIREMAQRMPAEVICLDAGFADDATKVNAGQIVASHARDEETSIAFKVV